MSRKRKTTKINDNIKRYVLLDLIYSLRRMDLVTACFHVSQVIHMRDIEHINRYSCYSIHEYIKKYAK
jgi:hypothetical protein